MDLVSTVRKEGSRGGRGDFKWSDVQSSSHRENYLGHSLMAPVGRWQKGRDLNWYAKGDDDNTEEDSVERAARERREEIRKIKEAEQDALAKALGYEVAPRNPNMEALGDKREVDRVLKGAGEDGGEEGQGGTGVGFGAFRAMSGHPSTDTAERLEGNAEQQDAELKGALKEYRRRHGDDASKRKRSRSRERHRDYKRDERRHDEDRGSHRRRRSRSTERRRRRHSRPRSRSRERRPRDGREYDKHHRRERSRSPYLGGDRRHSDNERPRHRDRNRD